MLSKFRSEPSVGFLRRDRGDGPRRMARGRRPFLSLEMLESRVLLSTVVFTWTDRDQDNLWSNADNWNDSNGNQATSAPNSAYDQVVFTAGTSDWVDVDGNYTIGSLIVQGGSNIDLDFDADGHTLAVSQNDDHTGGYIDLDQAAGTGTLLTISNDQADWGSHDTVHADEVELSGDVTGWTTLTVNANNTLWLNDDLNTTHYVFNLYDHGLLEAPDAYFTGKDLPGVGAGDDSSIHVDGDLAVDNQLWVGGNGVVNMWVDGGFTSGTDLYIFNDSRFTAENGAYAQFFGNAHIGSPGLGYLLPAGMSSIPSGITTATGAQCTVSGGATLDLPSGGWIDMGGGHGVSLTIDSGGVVEASTVDAEAGSGGTGPQIYVSGTGSALDASEGLKLIDAGGTAPGIRIIDSATVTVSGSGSGDSFVAESVVSTSPVLVDIEYGGVLDIDSGEIGGAVMAGTPCYEGVTINGTGSQLIVHGPFVIGNNAAPATPPAVYPLLPMGVWVVIPGEPGSCTFFVDAGGHMVATNSLYPIVKNPNADIGGSGAYYLAGKFVTGGLRADVIPGDASDPTGTMTMYGVLDASSGMTLDSYLDPVSGQSSLLDVTEAATIAGTIAFYTPADTDSDAFSAGQTYTVLEAGTLSGTFSNLAPGVQALPDPADPQTPLLPILPVGLRWLATYSSTSLVLSVISIAKATDLYAYSNPDFLTYTTTQPVTFNWTNHDPGIVSSYIEVKEGDGSNSEGNYFTVGHVEGNVDTFSFGASDVWSFQTGVTYTFRVRTLTAAGAVDSDPYTFTVTNFTPDSDLSISDELANPDGDGSFFDLVDGADPEFGYGVVGKSSSGPFPDRWVQVQNSDEIEGYLAEFQGSVNADSLYLLEQKFTYDENDNPIAEPFTGTAIPDPAGYSLQKPSISAAFGEDGVLLSWEAVPGADKYYIIDESQIGTDHFIWDMSTTNTSKLITYDSLFAPHELHRNDFFAVMAVSSATGELSAASGYIDAEPAATTTILMTTVSDKAVRLTWDNNSFNEDGYDILRSDDGGTTYTRIGTAEADDAEYTDRTAVLGHAYKYEVVAYRNVGGGYLDSAASGPSASVKLAPPFAALTAPPQINDGSPSRSMVTSVTVVFNQPVTLGDGAITITQQQADGSDPVVMPIAVNNPSGDGATWVITFTDPMYVDGSLADGTYALTINAGAVTSTLTGQTGVQDQTVEFFRLYGDVSGDGAVDGTDVSIVESGSGTAGDVNGDGVVNYVDLILVYELQGDHV